MLNGAAGLLSVAALLAERGTGPALAEFSRLGLLTVPAGPSVTVLALWAALHVTGG